LADFARERIFLPLEADNLTFGIHDIHGDVSGRIAPTEEDPWRGRVLQGEVHDENAAALGGIAGHAGLFGTAQAVGQITKAWLDSFLGKPSIFRQELVSQFVNAQPGTSWALGWDTPSYPSSSGQWFSPQSFGHLGFTGTSIWIDPIRELEVIFLSNRVHPTRELSPGFSPDSIQTKRARYSDMARFHFPGCGRSMYVGAIMKCVVSA